jgi:PAS domain S-box-containing protein
VSLKSIFYKILGKSDSLDAVRSVSLDTNESLEVTELKQQLSELQQRYQILTENLAASVIIRDDSARLAYASPYTLVLTGYSPKNFIGAKEDFFESIVHPEDRQHYLKALKISIQGEPFQSRFRVIHKSGMEVWAEQRSVPIFDSEGNVEGFLAIILDVTSQVRYQKQVEERTRDLHDISYMISHDLRSPILTIKGMVEVLKQDLAEGNLKASSESLGFISSAIQRLESLISSVLNYFKLSAQEVDNSNLSFSKLISDVITDLNSVKTGKIEISGEEVSVSADEQKCYRIFSNLISNAFKYKDPNRDLFLKISWERSLSKRDLIVRVEDNGLGIPEEKLTAIFRPFQRAHSGSNVDGFGVGLASVKKLVQLAGGSISVESEVGKGSKFIVILKNCSPVST